MRAIPRATSVSILLVLGCGDSGDATTATTSATNNPSAFTTVPTADTADVPTTTAGSASDTASSADISTSAPTASDADTGFKFDLADDADVGATGGVVVPSCKVSDMGDAVQPCADKAPPDSFDPEVQWTWTGDNGETQAFAIPLVANLTDDNADGAIDLCDVPDVVIQSFVTYGVWSGSLYVLDGATGTVHWKAGVVVDTTITPALGDIDGDGLAEIVAFDAGTQTLVAFEHDGPIKWHSSVPWPEYTYGAIGMADVDNDGDVEIFAGNLLFDHNGVLVVQLGDASGMAGFGNATVAADLDGDGDLELVMGRSAWHHTGANVYTTGLEYGYPQVADLDGDGLPEVLVETQNGISLLEHTGAVKYQDLRPTGAPAGGSAWYRPSTVHDFDGDGQPEFAVSALDKYAVYETDATVTWSASVLDSSGIAGSTAFDFLGDGVAEAMYADETSLYAYDGKTGAVLLQVPRSSGTIIEYPVVVDVDNDGSAEVLVVSNASFTNMQTAPALQVIRDKQDRWIPARRIWNQHTYHVTNVREDGTIPQFEPPHWKALNTFRTQAQVGVGGVCMPVPPG